MFKALFTFMKIWIFSLKTQISYFVCIFGLFFMALCMFPQLFPDFVAYAMTSDNLEISSSENLPNMEELAPKTSNFPTPMQKEGALLAGYVLYWAVVGLSVSLSACTFFWLYTSGSKC